MQRFFKSIDFIEQHLFERISVHDIAKASHFSTYYFCRVFRSLVGDTPKEYLRKRRLSIAAEKLLYEDIGILDLAIDFQFESQEAFTRAFKNQFKTTPAQYRKNKQAKNLLYREQFSLDELSYLQTRLSMEPEIITQPEIKVVGIVTHYDDTDFDLLKIWQPFLTYQSPIANVIGSEGFGIYEASTSDDGSVGFSYLCSIEVSSFDDVPKDMESRLIPEQRYAKFTHKGPVANLNETLKYIWGSWLPKSKYDYVEKSDFELYPQDFDDSNPDNVIYLHIPIKPR